MQLVYNTEKYEQEIQNENSYSKNKNFLIYSIFQSSVINDHHIPIANSNIYAVLRGWCTIYQVNSKSWA